VSTLPPRLVPRDAVADDPAIACRIVGIQITNFAREVGPFVLALVAILLMVTYFPSIVLFLPTLVMGN